MKQLTAVQVKNFKEAGNYADGNGLRLKVSKAGGKAWLFRYRIHGKEHEMGLGTYPARSLKDAREEAVRLRRMVLDGIDPLVERAREKQAAREALTFEQCTYQFHEMKSAEWTSEVYTRNWIDSMKQHAFPVLGSMLAAEVETEHVLRVLRPLWSSQPVLASKLRERIEAVLNWSMSLGYRERGINPAVWRGHLEHALPKVSKVHKPRHHPSLPYQKIGSFMVELQEVEGLPARALELAVLTACRSEEVRGATWDEIDLGAGVWTIPAARMKSDKVHRVPLTRLAIELLKALPGRDGYVFPSARCGWRKPMASTEMWRILKGLRPDKTVHGLRSSFRQWAAEQTNYPRELAEISLAHVVANSTEQAYQRSDLLEKRRPLMQAWADHCDRAQSTADVVSIRGIK